MAINRNVFLHESDKAALNALEAIPGFKTLMKGFMKLWNEKLIYIQNMANNVRIDDKQLKKYHDMLPPICEKLGIEVPDLFLTLNVVPNAYTSGDEKACIVLTSGLLENMPEELIPTILAHECGHIACHHVLYRTMGQLILNGAISSFLNTSLLGIISQPILLSAFAYWMRCSELSADRAAILCDGTADKVMEMCMRFAGFNRNIEGEMDLQSFMEQAREYQQLIKENSVNQSMEYLLYGNRSHPITSLRALEAYEWAKSENFLKSKQYFDACKNDQKPAEVPVSWNEKHFLNRNYEEVVKELEAGGFSPLLFRTAEKNIFQLDGAVTKVAINGSNEYKDGDWVDPDCRVEVTYNQPFTAEEEKSRHAGDIRLPYSLSTLAGEDYKEVERKLFELGFANTTLVPVYGLAKKAEQIGKVITIRSDRSKLNKDDYVPIMEEIRIEYCES